MKAADEKPHTVAAHTPSAGALKGYLRVRA